MSGLNNAKSVEIISPTAGKLADLASEIHALHESFIDHLQVTLDRAMALGDALIRAKPLVGHGRWLQWLGTNTKVSESECQRYMQLARHRAVIEAKAAHVRDLTIGAVLKLIAKPRDDEPTTIPSPSAKTTSSEKRGQDASEKRIKAALAAMHDCEPSERRRVLADPGIEESVQPPLIEHEDIDDEIDRRHRQLDDLHAAWDRAEAGVRQSFIRHIVADGAVIQAEELP